MEPGFYVCRDKKIKIVAIKNGYAFGFDADGEAGYWCLGVNDMTPYEEPKVIERWVPVCEDFASAGWLELQNEKGGGFVMRGKGNNRKVLKWLKVTFEQSETLNVKVE